MVVIGGMTRRFGPIVCGLLLQVIQYKVRGYGSEYTMLIFSRLVLILMLFPRDGLLGLADSAVRRLLPKRDRWQAEPEVAATSPWPRIALVKRGRRRLERADLPVSRWQ